MLGSIAGFLESIWEYLYNTIQTIAMAFKYVLSASENVVALVGYLPPIIGAALVITIGVFIVRFLLLK